MADGGPEAIDAQLDDPGIELVPMDDKGVPFFGPLQAFEGLADAEPVQRFAGEADWVEAGGDIPEKYLEWIEGAEARGERVPAVPLTGPMRSEEHTSELQSLMRISYAVFCLKKKKKKTRIKTLIV